MPLYTVLNQAAKDWWFHKELRAKGQIEKARDCERRDIKLTCEHLRRALANGGKCYVRPNGFTLEIEYGADGHCTDTLSGYSYHKIPEACAIVGIPVIEKA